MIHLTKFLKRYIMIILNGAESSNFYNHIKEKYFENKNHIFFIDHGRPPYSLSSGQH